MIKYNNIGKGKRKLTILYHEEVDCDGFRCHKEFSKLIKKTGKKIYNRAHEWCCGHGSIGFQLLADNICRHLVLTDKFPLAILDCHYTIALNNLHDKVTTYKKDLLSEIPISEQWDLFVANPPWRPNKNTFKESELEYLSEGGLLTSNDERKMIDVDWKLHIDLWDNISQFLTDDADIYIYEDRRFTNEQLWSECWRNNKLYLHDVYDNFGNSINGTGFVMHIKKNLNTV